MSTVESEGSRRSKDNNISSNIEECLDLIGFGRFHYYLLFLCGVGFAAGTVQLMILSLVVEPLHNSFPDSSENTIRSILSTVSFLGEIFGGFLWGSIGDNVGRKTAFLGSVFFTAVFSLVAAFSCSLEMFYAIRFFLGFSMGGHMSSDFIFFMEFHPPNFKRSYTPLLILFGIVGVIFVGGSSILLLSTSWRIFLIVCSLPFWLLVILRLFFRFESPRYLLAKGKHEEAVNTLSKMALSNRLDNEKITLLEETLKNLKGSEIIKNPKWYDVWSKGYRTTLLMVCSVWFSVTISYYGCLLWIPKTFALRGIPSVDIYFGFLLLGIAQLPGLAWIIFSIYFLKRKQFSLSINLICCCVVSICFLFVRDQVSVIVVNCALYFFIVGCWAILYVGTPTLFPVLMRSRVSSWTGLSGKLAGAISSPLANLIWNWSLAQNNGDNFVWIFFACVFLLAAVISTSLPFQ